MFNKNKMNFIKPSLNTTYSIYGRKKMSKEIANKIIEGRKNE
jgi:hypothetical protein